MPYAMQWPGVLAGGTRFRHPVSSLDIVPTALAAAGAQPPAAPLDGVNLLPHLTGSLDGPPHDHLVWRSGPNAAVRRGPWKLLLTPRLARLYDVESDPGEAQDLAGSNPDLVDQLRGLLERWSADKPPPRQGARRVQTKYNGDRIEWHI